MLYLQPSEDGNEKGKTMTNIDLDSLTSEEAQQITEGPKADIAVAKAMGRSHPRTDTVFEDHQYSRDGGAAHQARMWLRDEHDLRVNIIDRGDHIHMETAWPECGVSASTEQLATVRLILVLHVEGVIDG